MVAIETKYIGPTNHRGSRVVASTETGLRVTIAWDDALDVFPNHAAAARLLANQHHWAGDWTAGATKSGYAFVRVQPRAAAFTILPITGEE